ncbi:lipase (class 3) domain-containing protein [Ditylenchus destructor]|uniref:Lipase (Class 3) domain-containing protein n=1 Tax=Ditylenchus destructor TaxID=166010 RepID=A0AAD4NA21_9BILA|nr:lipase (class 3) domain-containing protein [Ditylenchus destructor]
MGVFSPLLCSLILAVLAYVEAGMVNVCSDIKDCVKCTDSYVNIFAFREYCRWCYSTNTCGGPISCPAGAATAQRDSFKCPTKASTAKGRRYTDKLGRSLYALTLAVKQKDPTPCLKNSRSDVKLIKYFEVECDASRNTCAGMLAVSEEAKALYVVYRGSTVDKQLFQEFVHGIGAQLGAWEKFVNGSGVMTYFYGAFQKLFLEGGMKESLIKLKESHEGYRVWITGHSLGGSLASMTALYLVNQTIFPADKVKLVTFGEPRTGNLKYAKAIEQNLNFRYRVINKNDIVTNIAQSVDPDGLLLSVASAERQPYFYRYAIHYNDGMERDDEFELCEYPEDHHCRNLALAGDVNDHMSYFGVKADDYLKAGCPKAMLL